MGDPDQLAQVRKFSNAGSLLAKYGAHSLEDGKFIQVMDTAVHASGTIYVADFTRIQTFTSAGAFIASWPASATHIALEPSGDVWAAEETKLRERTVCCSAACAFEAASSPCADDGNLCTNDYVGRRQRTAHHARRRDRREHLPPQARSGLHRRGIPPRA